MPPALECCCLSSSRKGVPLAGRWAWPGPGSRRLLDPRTLAWLRPWCGDCPPPPPGPPPPGAEGLLRLHGALLRLEPEVLHILPELLVEPLLDTGAQPLAPPVCRHGGPRGGRWGREEHGQRSVNTHSPTPSLTRCHHHEARPGCHRPRGVSTATRAPSCPPTVGSHPWRLRHPAFFWQGAQSWGARGPEERPRGVWAVAVSSWGPQ